MQIETFRLSAVKGKELNAVIWLPEGKARAIVQITHGMTEHIRRWDALAEALCQKGIVTAGFDLRGHGADVKIPGVAAFGERGWEASLEDMHCLFELLRQRFSGLPHYMLGFSLGSFLLREYLGRYSDRIAGAAFLGTGQQPGVLLALMQALVKTQMSKVGWDDTTPLVQKLSFGSYNSKFAPIRTGADWLCSDETQLDAYLQDPLCRKSISAGLFWQLLGAMKRCGASDCCKNWDKTVPVLLLSGAQDPVGSMGKGVRAVRDQLCKAGMRQVELQLLPGARHDLLHENISGTAVKAREILCKWVEKNGKL